ncbi:uncharacterized protein PAC_12195 [Phialocephala subalpina]|uniref:Cyclin N-terminal domain-containing protein n=1 Tax=Phialocephala subalpina TaxID=576137 RepID=A0A1L7XB86_9HELO|nr:uncharacterized protein PAC_12195 [Phialocephala subalpina]
MTPPMARCPSTSSFTESYFTKTYVPLSSLPTPPLSHSRNNSRQQSPEAFSPGQVLDPELFGPAIHLTNLIPTSTSLTSATVPLVHSILTLSNLPLETIALAVSILDSLNTKFALQWRQGCPLQVHTLPPPFNDGEGTLETQHIDEVHPEIIVLAALVLAVKFLDDRQQSTKEYAEDWGRGIWSCQQINFTQRCLLENLGYRLVPLWQEDIILEALEDMERAGQQHEPEIYDDDDEDWEFENYRHRVLDTFAGKAVLGLGNQLTPVETPLSENIKGTRDVSNETRIAFKGMQIQDRAPSPREPFPLFMEPSGRELGY